MIWFILKKTFDTRLDIRGLNSNIFENQSHHQEHFRHRNFRGCSRGVGVFYFERHTYNYSDNGERGLNLTKIRNKDNHLGTEGLLSMKLDNLVIEDPYHVTPMPLKISSFVQLLQLLYVYYCSTLRFKERAWETVNILMMSKLTILFMSLPCAYKNPPLGEECSFLARWSCSPMSSWVRQTCQPTPWFHIGPCPPPYFTWEDSQPTTPFMLLSVTY